MDYTEYVMKGLSNILYNATQHPNERTLDEVLDSIKRMLAEYQKQTGKDLKVVDFRPGRG